MLLNYQRQYTVMLRKLSENNRIIYSYIKKTILQKKTLTEIKSFKFIFLVFDQVKNYLHALHIVNIL